MYSIKLSFGKEPSPEKPQPNQEEFLTYYEKVKHQKHIFIYGVGGRCSSTALQRIFNSSNEICIWGEPWGMIDNLLHNLHCLMLNHTSENIKTRTFYFDRLKDSFQRNQHTLFYPNAFRPTDQLLKYYQASLANILKPINNVNRFGFKELHNNNNQVIKTLTETFPQSKILFIFRDPAKQWPSVKAMGCWHYSKDITNFIDTYSKIAKNFLDLYQQTPEKHRYLFINSQSLSLAENINKIIKFTEINSFDQALVNDQVSSNNPGLTDEEAITIANSNAQQQYEVLNQLALDQLNQI